MSTIENVALAVYISSSGKILGVERFGGITREIADDQLRSDYGTREGEVMQVEVRVTRSPASGADCGDCREFMAMRTCYDLSGRKVPCF
jgi:hypothetical protein